MAVPRRWLIRPKIEVACVARIIAYSSTKGGLRNTCPLLLVYAVAQLRLNTRTTTVLVCWFVSKAAEGIIKHVICHRVGLRCGLISGGAYVLKLRKFRIRMIHRSLFQMRVVRMKRARIRYGKAIIKRIILSVFILSILLGPSIEHTSIGHTVPHLVFHLVIKYVSLLLTLVFIIVYDKLGFLLVFLFLLKLLIIAEAQILFTVVGKHGVTHLLLLLQ